MIDEYNYAIHNYYNVNKMFEIKDNEDAMD
jgi:hypothetical protein